MIEELKVIMETVGMATDAAKDFGMVWLGIEAAKALCGYALGFFTILQCVKLLKLLIHWAQKDDFVATLRNIACPDSAYGVVTDGEKERIQRAVLKGAKEII